MRIALLVCCAALLVAGDALAQAPDPIQPQPPPPPPPQAYVQPLPPQPVYAPPATHTHRGVFVRFLIGPGGFRATSDQGANSYRVSGSGGGISIAVGGVVAPNLIVYGELFGDSATSPTLEVNGMSSTAGSNVTAGVAGIGPGVAYYFPSNFYIGGTIAASQISIQQDMQQVAHSDTGVGLSLHAGKEWWVSDGWGLGIALQVFGGTIPDGQANASWKTVGGSLAFSATYN